MPTAWHIPPKDSPSLAHVPAQHVSLGPQPLGTIVPSGLLVPFCGNRPILYFLGHNRPQISLGQLTTLHLSGTHTYGRSRDVSVPRDPTPQPIVGDRLGIVDGRQSRAKRGDGDPVPRLESHGQIATQVCTHRPGH